MSAFEDEADRMVALAQVVKQAERRLAKAQKHSANAEARILDAQGDLDQKRALYEAAKADLKQAAKLEP